MRECLVSTTDNPYDPFTQWEEWYEFDESHGYHTTSYLARIVVVSDDLSDEDYKMAVNDAVNEIVEFNLTGNYIKVVKENIKRPE